MKFLNAWIDPRVLRVKPADAEAYLVQRGWRRVDAANANLHAYAKYFGANDTVVAVPQRIDGSDYPQCVIDLVAALAFAEDRWAVEVLSDILNAKSAAIPGNAVQASQPTAAAAS